MLFLPLIAIFQAIGKSRNEDKKTREGPLRWLSKLIILVVSVAYAFPLSFAAAMAWYVFLIIGVPLIFIGDK